MLPNHIYAVILAGGSGTRFWPKSRQKSPKQLCKIGDQNDSMLQITLKRLDGFIPKERRIIVTHKDQAAQTRTDVGSLCQHVLAEPEARNTAAALAMAALEINKLATRSDKAPVMVSLHADAVISKEDIFKQSLKDAVAVAESGYLTLVGIKPTYPETGYGYIEIGSPLAPNGYKVKSFKEKPKREVAEAYLKDDRLFWNSGIFVWQTAQLIEELHNQVPAITEELNRCVADFPGFSQVPSADLAATYQRLPKIAIDNAVLETSKNVAMVQTTFDWQDVGSWDALAQTFGTDNDGNVRYGDIIALDTKNCTIDTDGPLVATIGIEDLVVVAAKGAILVCPKSRAQEVKKVVEELKAQGREEYL